MNFNVGQNCNIFRDCFSVKQRLVENMKQAIIIK